MAKSNSLFGEHELKTPEIRADLTVNHLAPRVLRMATRSLIVQEIRAAEIAALVAACQDVCDLCADTELRYGRMPTGPIQEHRWVHFNKRGTYANCEATVIWARIARILTPNNPKESPCPTRT